MAKRIIRDPPDTLDRLWMGEHCDNFVLHLQQHQLGWQNRLLDKNSPKLSNVFYCECECRLFFFSFRCHLNKDISCFQTSVGSWCAEAKHLLIKNGSGITCTNFPCLERWQERTKNLICIRSPIFFAVYSIIDSSTQYLDQDSQFFFNA